MDEETFLGSCVELSDKFNGKNGVKIEIVGNCTFICDIPRVIVFTVLCAFYSNVECHAIIFFSAYHKDDYYYIPSECNPDSRDPHKFVINLEGLVELITFFIEERKVPLSECLKKVK